MSHHQATDVVEFEEFLQHIPSYNHTNQEVGQGAHICKMLFPAKLRGNIAPPTNCYLMGALFYGEGEIDGHVDGQKVSAKEYKSGLSLSMTQPNCSQAWNWDAHDPNAHTLGTVGLSLPEDFFKNMLIKALDKEPNQVEVMINPIVHDEFLNTLVLQIYQANQQEHYMGKLYNEKLLDMLGIHMLRHHSTMHYIKDEHKGGLSPFIVNRIKDYINTHYDKNISLDTLASLAGLSTYHFSRAFKKSVGLPPHQFLLLCRVEKAKDLLKNTQLSVEKIANAVGYQNTGHFSRVFFKHTQRTPTKFRKSY